VELTARLEELVRLAASPAITRLGAEAMSEVMTQATASAIGADLRLSHFRGGPATFEATGEPGLARLSISGAAYTIADKGRSGGPARIRPFHQGKGGHAPALNTPRGYRAVIGPSSSAGKGITNANREAAYEAGKQAMLNAIWGGRR
jgi:hypothetical protein